MTECLIGIGSNLGDRKSIVDHAVQQLEDHFQVKRISRWFTYPAIGKPQESENIGAEDGKQPDFLNGAVLIESALSAQETAKVLHQIEAEAGRQRLIRWSSRTLDLDLLLYGEHEIHTEKLFVPHPRMLSRRFVLEPAAEIAPEMIHPHTGWTIDRLWRHLRTARPFFAVLGSDSADVRVLMEKLFEEFGGQLIWRDFDEGRDEGNGTPAGDNSDQILEYLKSTMMVLDQVASGPWFSDFWFGQFEVFRNPDERIGYDSWSPKAFLVIDPPNSPFVKALREREPGIPWVFLSSNEQDALQDAFGAVQGMTFS